MRVSYDSNSSERRESGAVTAAVAEVADAVVERCLDGLVSPAIAIAQILSDGGDVTTVEDAVQRAVERLPSAHGVGSAASVARPRLDAMLALLGDVTPGCVRIIAALRDSDPTVATLSGKDTTPADTIDRCSAFFDDLVQQSEEASVALYSLGNPALLKQASDEIIDVLDLWGTIAADAVVLDIGCGIGRLEQLLSSRVAEVHGIDVSPGMIAAARRRCAELGNVHFQTSNGRDLSAFSDDSFDLVMAVDSFPYLHGAGMALVGQHFREAHRVLRNRGHFIILNFSYRGDPLGDRRDVEHLARNWGFDVIVRGVQPFTLWDGMAFHLKPRSAC